jgi:hypothetical protein
MNKLLKYSFAAILCLLASCSSFYSGNISGGMPMPSKHSKIVDLAIGTSSAHYFCGLGGVSKSFLVLQAKREMYRGYPLMPLQIYSNVTVDFKRSFYLFYWNTKVTVSADIVDYDSNRTLKPIIISKNGSYNVGDTVFAEYSDGSFSNVQMSKILLIGNEEVKIGFKYRDVYTTKWKKPSNLINLRPAMGCDSVATFKIGDRVTFKSYSDLEGSKKTFIGKVINVVDNKEYLLEFEHKGEKLYYLALERYLKKFESR